MPKQQLGISLQTSGIDASAAIMIEVHMIAANTGKRRQSSLIQSHTNALFTLSVAT